MSIGPFLRLEYAGSIERGELFRDRLRAAVPLGLVLALALVVWDWNGWDRASVAGAATFAHVAFGLVVAVQACLAVALVFPVARMIALERDRKTLDALLATRLSSLQIVVGVMAAGLFRCANGMAATLPVVILMVYLGGVDPRFVMLACVGLGSTALGVAALAVVASVESRTSVRALGAAAGLLQVWFVLPVVSLMLRGLFLPAVPAWLVTPVLWALDSSPFGPAGSFFRILPRPWGIVAGVYRMAALQAAVAAALTAWAVWRLRPAARALYDAEGRIGMLNALRAANRSLPYRHPCGADPVLWNEVSSDRARSRAGRFAGWLVNLLTTSLIAVGTWWFAGPAFLELAERGYGPSAQAYTMPEINPLARVLVERLIVRSSTGARPGQARLEFNLALRQISALMALALVIPTLASGTASVARERQRDTWLGLLVTPLSGADILRGKVLGSFWRARGTAGTLLGLWVVGLASGAVHPLGFLAAVVWMGVSGPLYAAIGVASVLDPDTDADTPSWWLHPSAWPARVAGWLGMMLLVSFVPMVLASVSLFSYEDVHAAAHSKPFPLLDETFLQPWLGARAVTFACLAGTVALVVGAAAFTRSLTRSFDTLVGRPCRPPGHGPAATTSLPVRSRPRGTA